MVRGMERKKKQAGFVHIGPLINDVLKSYRRESDSELIRVWQIWEGAVGGIIAQNAKPAAFKGRILLVHATSSTWIHQLQFLKKDMIDKLNAALGKPLIDDLKFKIGPI
jgi:predicted nucleic acid-binding Zn ribbon protein